LVQISEALKKPSVCDIPDGSSESFELFGLEVIGAAGFQPYAPKMTIPRPDHRKVYG
jgi:hypothetical protein